MMFRSTKSEYPLASFKEAMLRCLPSDGGLYVPDQAEDLKSLFLHMDNKNSFNELVASVALSFLEEGVNFVSAAKIAAAKITAATLTDSAYSFQPELIKLDNNLALLNLYNGPTGCFKDFGIAFMSAMLEVFIKPDHQIMIISAAKPDTGVSMAHAFSGRKGILLVLLYPSGQIRGLDPSAFVQNGGNIIPIQIKGTFDDCQRLIIETINDLNFSQRYNVTCANSINPGRLFPQIFYYLYALIQVKNNLNGELIFSVPCGNFGSLLAGLYAWKFGLPVSGFIAAMNENNQIGDFFSGKNFIPKQLVHTNSPSLDVSIPTNFDRLASFYSESPAVMRNMVYPASINDENTIKAIKNVYEKYNTFIDPHTAVAFAAAQKMTKEKNWGDHIYKVILATGHPARSAGLIKKATGKAIKIPPFLQALQKKCDPIALISPQLDAFENAIASCF
jgi:threonine synthase